ncbi:hypothetical protein WJX84_006734 [Apatococcus fuscideae]|uniref:Uncharacterized protein n=1 Tax=Apatococcus fuscideae TaxID=2026836 RepID=A0AAW1SKH5_9CHLO
MIPGRLAETAFSWPSSTVIRPDTAPRLSSSDHSMAKYTQGGAAQDQSDTAHLEAELKSRSETSPNFQQGHDDVAAPLADARAQAAQALDKARSTLGDGMQTASETYDDAASSASKTYDDAASSASSTYSTATSAIDENLNHASNILEGGMQQTADVVKMGAAWTMAITGWASDRSQAMLETGRAHIAAEREAAFDYMKGCIAAATEYPEFSYPAMGLAALIILPGPRQFFLRQTVGRFRSEEGIFRSAQNKAQQLSESLTDQSTEADKLKQRLSLAWEEYSRGQAKLKATNRELQSLAKRVSKNDAKAQVLLQDLRQLPSAQALALRAQVALSSASAQRQWTALEKDIYSLSKRGL